MNGFVEAIVAKVSETGKSMLVGIKPNKYVIGYQFGWAANPDNLIKGDKIAEFPLPKGTEPCIDKEGKPITHEDGSAVVRFVF